MYMARLSRKKSKSRRPGKPRKSKKTKRKKSSKKSVSSSKGCAVEMKNAELTALCMKCYRATGLKKCVMKMEGRKCKKTKNNRNMILGLCVKCGGKMARLL
jgi:hypothetical protein